MPSAAPVSLTTEDHRVGQDGFDATYWPLVAKLSAASIARHLWSTMLFFLVIQFASMMRWDALSEKCVFRTCGLAFSISARAAVTS